MTIGDIGDATVTVSTVYVDAWAAMTLDAKDGTPQRFGACLDDSVIPAAHRRRLGNFERMAVSCGLSIAATDNSDLVFCSRYGDVDLAHKLLVEVVAGGLLSPAAFSLSVHNAVPAVMDLVRGSRTGHTAIAAGSQSLSAGLAEAWSKLVERPDDKIVFVYADCALPAIYQQFSEMKLGGTAVALTLSARMPVSAVGRFVLERTSTANVLDAPDSEELAARLMQILGDASGGASVRWQSRGLHWLFAAGADATN
jgi:hypothetical protein